VNASFTELAGAKEVRVRVKLDPAVIDNARNDFAKKKKAIVVLWCCGVH